MKQTHTGYKCVYQIICSFENTDLVLVVTMRPISSHYTINTQEKGYSIIYQRDQERRVTAGLLNFYPSKVDETLYTIAKKDADKLNVSHSAVWLGGCEYMQGGLQS